MSSQQSFLSTLTPEQERHCRCAFFLRHKLDPVANPEDFSIIGNMYNPGRLC